MESMFRVEVDERVFKEAERWFKEAQIKKLLEFLKALEEHPIPSGFDIRRVKGMEIKGMQVYALRIGKYRIFYGVNWKENKIYVAKIEPRGRAYKR